MCSYALFFLVLSCCADNEETAISEDAQGWSIWGSVKSCAHWCCGYKGTRDNTETFELQEITETVTERSDPGINKKNLSQRIFDYFCNSWKKASIKKRAAFCATLGGSTVLFLITGGVILPALLTKSGAPIAVLTTAITAPTTTEIAATTTLSAALGVGSGAIMPSEVSPASITPTISPTEGEPSVMMPDDVSPTSITPTLSSDMDVESSVMMPDDSSPTSITPTISPTESSLSPSPLSPALPTLDPDGCLPPKNPAMYRPEQVAPGSPRACEGDETYYYDDNCAVLNGKPMQASGFTNTGKEIFYGANGTKCLCDPPCTGSIETECTCLHRFDTIHGYAREDCEGAPPCDAGCDASFSVGQIECHTGNNTPTDTKCSHGVPSFKAIISWFRRYMNVTLRGGIFTDCGYSDSLSRAKRSLTPLTKLAMG